jgi:hypothetical protein
MKIDAVFEQTPLRGQAPLLARCPPGASLRPRPLYSSRLIDHPIIFDAGDVAWPAFGQSF